METETEIWISPEKKPARTKRRHWRQPAVLYPVLCCAAILICIALAHPFADCAFNDDWSYSHVALKFAETGRLHYNGWGSPMILFQTLWGAAWIRLFGFSFNVLRAATIPFSLGFILLVYALARRAGLTRQFAFFGALTIGTSPLFLPLAASFMTEAYSCFFLMASIYAAIACIETTELVKAIRWLWVLALAGLAGGSNRQVVWAAPLALIPYLFWIKRSDRRLARHAGIAYVVCVGSIALLAVNFSQPYAPFELPRQQLIAVVLSNWPVALVALILLSLTCVLVALPAFICTVPAWNELGTVRWIGCVAICTVATMSLTVIYGSEFGFAPFLGNILSRFGIFRLGDDALGNRPSELPVLLRIALTWFVLLVIAVFIHLLKLRRDPLSRVPVTVFAIFTCAYIPFLIPGALLGLVFDRYTLPLLPIFVVITLLCFQSRLNRVAFAAWACLALFAAYSIATTHDYFSALRARVSAAETLERLDIPRNHISAGVEYDGWTQLQFAGRIEPALYGDSRGNTTDNFWFWAKATALHPDYIVSYWSPAQLPAKTLVTVPFDTWLPPFHWTVVALRRDELSAAARKATPTSQAAERN